MLYIMQVGCPRNNSRVSRVQTYPYLQRIYTHTDRHTKFRHQPFTNWRGWCKFQTTITYFLYPIHGHETCSETEWPWGWATAVTHLNIMTRYGTRFYGTRFYGTSFYGTRFYGTSDSARTVQEQSLKIRLNIIELGVCCHKSSPTSFVKFQPSAPSQSHRLFPVSRRRREESLQYQNNNTIY